MPHRYDPDIDILVLCTGNQCRSPMAEALLRDRLAARGIDARVHSAGELQDGVEASGGSVRAMAARGLDLRAHRSRQATAEMLREADLVVAMARRHLRAAVATAPETFPRTYTLKEIVRRGRSHGGRRPDEPLGDWLRRVHQGRTTAALLGEHPDDDVADPIGQPDHAYETTARELERLVDELVDLVLAPLTTRETA